MKKRVKRLINCVLVFVIIIGAAGCSKNKDIMVEDNKENVLGNSIFVEEKELNLPDNIGIIGWKNDDELLANVINNENNQSELCSINVKTGEQKKIDFDGRMLRSPQAFSELYGDKILKIKNNCLYADNTNDNTSEKIIDLGNEKELLDVSGNIGNFEADFVQGDNDIVFFSDTKRKGEHLESIFEFVNLKTKEIIKSRPIIDLMVYFVCAYNDGEKNNYYAVTNTNELYEIINEDNTLKLNLVERIAGENKRIEADTKYYLTKDNRIMGTRMGGDNTGDVFFYNLKDKKNEDSFRISEVKNNNPYDRADIFYNYNKNNNLVCFSNVIADYNRGMYLGIVKDNKIQARYKLKSNTTVHGLNMSSILPLEVMFNKNGNKAILFKVFGTSDENNLPVRESYVTLCEIS